MLSFCVLLCFRLYRIGRVIILAGSGSGANDDGARETAIGEEGMAALLIFIGGVTVHDIVSHESKYVSQDITSDSCK